MRGNIREVEGAGIGVDIGYWAGYKLSIDALFKMVAKFNRIWRWLPCVGVPGVLLDQTKDQLPLIVLTWTTLCDNL